MTAYDSGDDNVSPPKKISSEVEERILTDDITNELYMQPSPIVVPERKKEMLNVTLDLENGLTIDALVDLGAYVSAVPQKELVILKNKP